VKTIFWLFADYPTAKSAVAGLSARGFEEAKMDAIALEDVVKDAMDEDWATVATQVTDKVGEQTLEGLDRLFGGERPVKGPGMENLLSTGTLATLTVKTALELGGKEGGFRDALADLGVPRDLTVKFVDGIKQGGVLFWLRCDDDQVPKANNALREHQSAILASYTNP